MNHHLTPAEQDWRNHAACQNSDPELWFAQIGTPDAEIAKDICHTCPVRTHCDLYATKTKQTHGIWAGHNLDRTIGNRTHCRHGHPFTIENTIFEHKHGRREYRICRECKRLKDETRHARERASA